AIAALEQVGVDIILFAGGDGTARDVFSGLHDSVLCLGIPTGCKIYSGVFSITPESASEVVIQILNGELFEYATSDVLDIDEVKYRAGKITTRLYGEMLTPRSAEYMQNVKVAGRESEDLVKEDIAAWMTESMQEDTLYLIGSGSICMAIKDYLGIDGSLLGVDAVLNEALIAKDATEAELLALIKQHSGDVCLIITPIGGQGILLGRGNHTICHLVIEHLGMKNTQVVASKGKLKTLEGRPLRIDTGDIKLNEKLSGYVSVITGYDERVLYQVAAL
ncbi:MAG: NAD(+)/NADH kinase, partial [Gammaproteobacteria bacterium]|nr:NAD(+)/NADH kinase [Gammaproteobacteria bacterium]NNJ72339.1 ATP-NAD kinase [Enterobacterales bacterium]